MKFILILGVLVLLFYFGMKWAGEGSDTTNKKVQEKQSQQSTGASPSSSAVAASSSKTPASSSTPDAANPGLPSSATTIGGVAPVSVSDIGGPAPGTASRMGAMARKAAGVSTPAKASSSGGGSVVRMGAEGASAANSDFGARMNRCVEPTGNPNEVKVMRDLIAYDPSSPAKQLGKFITDSLLTLGEKDAASGMIHVTYRNTDGSLVHALCRAEDVGR